MIGRVLKGLTALVGLAALLAGVPAALLAISGNPLPDQWPNVDELGRLLTTPDTGQLFLGFLLWVAWIAWAYFTLAVLAEFVSQLSKRNWRLPVLTGGQRASAGLVAAVIAMVIAPSVSAMAAPAVGPAIPHPPSTAVAAPTPDRAATAQPSSPAASAPSAARPAATPQVSRAAMTPYTVKENDTLWGIAEREYGDGHQYKLIAAANPQVRDSDWIVPGQVIQLPDLPKPVAPAVDEYVVRNGDTLSGIAEDKLGNGSDWPKIAKANGHKVQPDGNKLSDPDEIHPGWHLTIPAAGSPQGKLPPAEKDAEPKPIEKLPPQVEDKPPTEAEQTPLPQDPPASVGETAPVPGSHQAPPGQAAAADVVEAGFPVRTVGGAGVLLAAGIIGLLTSRKALQLLRRRPGQKIPVPPATALTTEAQLRTIGEPLTAERLNLTLRALASLLAAADRTLPPLASVHLSDSSIVLHLHAPEPDPPAPFRAGPGAGTWSITVHDVDRLLAGSDALDTMPAPWPTLVTIGHDHGNGHILVDLEYLAALAITAPDPAVARAVLAAITVELATSIWADDLRVTLVGDLEDLATALGVGRVRYLARPGDLIDRLQRRAERDRNHIRSTGHTAIDQARLDADSADALTPEVVLIATDLTDSERNRLTELLTSLPRVAVAAVTSTGSPLNAWNLRLDDAGSAMLEPLGLPLRPQLLGGADYDAVVELMLNASRTDTEPADWWDDTVAPVAAGEASRDSAGDHLGELSPPRTEAELHSLLPAVQPEGPWLQLLGPVEIHDATGTIERARTEPCRRLAVFLSLHPEGTPGAVIDDTLVITSSYRLSVLSRLRSWLGETPDGEEYLPPAVGAKYRFHPSFRSDWDRYNDLTAGGVNITSTKNLVEALKLVKGRPISSGSPQLYSWASFHYDRISAKIRDSALQVAERSLATNDLDQARWAITTAHQAGLQHDEFLAQAELRVERAAGNAVGIKVVVDRLNHTVRMLETDLLPETIDLLHELEHGRRMAPGLAHG